MRLIKCMHIDEERGVVGVTPEGIIGMGHHDL